MQIARKMMRGIMSLVLISCLWSSQTLLSKAEEAQGEPIAGYHERVTNEDEVIDTWYGVARGTYLQSGTSGLKRAGTGKVSVSGLTNAHSVCDEVKVGVYLDQSSDGGNSFGTIGVYHFKEEETSSCYGSKSNISVTSGWKYHVRGVHSVVEGDVIETTTTSTGVLTAS